MTTVTDNFNRADESPLSAPWETLTASGINLASNQCQGSSGTCLSGYRASSFAFLANQSSSVRVITPGTDDNAGVGVRCASTGGGRGYIAEYRNGDGRIYISKMTAGILATIGAPVVTWSSGDVLKLTATTNGANCDLEVFQNGVSVGTVTDSTSPYTDGQPALFYQLDNFNATKLDDWQGDDASSAGNTVTPAQGVVSLIGAVPVINDFTNARYSEVLINAAGSPVSNRTGLRLIVWYGGHPSGAPDLSYSDMTTGAGGTASYSLASGSLVLGQRVFGVITDGGASLSSYTCGLLTLNYS